MLHITYLAEPMAMVEETSVEELSSKLQDFQVRLQSSSLLDDCRH